MGQQKLIGALILVLAIAGVLAWKYLPTYAAPLRTMGEKIGLRDTPPKIEIKGLIGGEKAGLFEDEKMKTIWLSRYGLVAHWKKAGSIEMVSSEPGDNDFLFPSNQLALELFKSHYANRLVKEETVFNSPIVLYSWAPVADALIKTGYVQNVGGVLYITNLKGLIEAVEHKKKWSDLGLDQLFGNVTIYTTDPDKSSSGNLFAGLVATLLSDGDLSDETRLNAVADRVGTFFSRIGYMEGSSKDLFNQYLRMGMGAKPIVAGYEAQMVEFARENPEAWANIQSRIRVLYPAPTVWSAHTVIATSSGGTRLINALNDKDVQALAWTEHGFRTGIAGIVADAKSLGMPGVPASIDKVVPPLSSAQMQRIMQTLQAPSP